MLVTPRGRPDWLESNVPKSTRSRLPGGSRNAYDFRDAKTSVPEEDVPSYEQTRREISAAFQRMADSGERPDPAQWARMEAGLREGTARGKATQPRKPAEPTVYYFRVGNRIKIGYTQNLASRIRDLAPEEVLGWEPGDRSTETLRHTQFRAYRMAREWFEDCKAIRDHIATLNT